MSRFNTTRRKVGASSRASARLGINLPLLKINVLDVRDIGYVVLVPQGKLTNQIDSVLAAHRRRINATGRRPKPPARQGQQ